MCIVANTLMIEDEISGSNIFIAEATVKHNL